MHDYVRNIHANDVYILCKLKLLSYISIHNTHIEKMSVFDDRCRTFGKTGSEEKRKAAKTAALRNFKGDGNSRVYGAFHHLVVAGKRREHQVIHALWVAVKVLFHFACLI